MSHVRSWRKDIKCSPPRKAVEGVNPYWDQGKGEGEIISIVPVLLFISLS